MDTKAADDRVELRKNNYYRCYRCNNSRAEMLLRHPKQYLHMYMN